jgi:hypothetical protein
MTGPSSVTITALTTRVTSGMAIEMMVARSTGFLKSLLRYAGVAPFAGRVHACAMGDLQRLPQRQAVLVDERGVSLRLTWHGERDQVVMSIWHDGTCAASFRLPIGEAPRMAGFLMAAMGDWTGGIGATPAASVRRPARFPVPEALTWARQRLDRFRRAWRESA